LFTYISKRNTQNCKIGEHKSHHSFLKPKIPKKLITLTQIVRQELLIPT